jgi:hypothetical protein
MAKPKPFSLPGFERVDGPLYHMLKNMDLPPHSQLLTVRIPATGVKRDMAAIKFVNCNLMIVMGVEDGVCKLYGTYQGLDNKSAREVNLARYNGLMHLRRAIWELWTQLR